MSKFIGILIEGLTDSQEEEFCGVYPCVGTKVGLFLPLDDESELKSENELFNEYKYTLVYI